MSLPSLDSLTPETVGAAASEIAASLKADVSGSMDGERIPMTKLEEIKTALQPYQQKYGHYLGKIRPWREFFYLQKPQGDLKARLESNLTHYQINYAVIFLILMVGSIIINPRCLVVIGVLALVWVAFLRKNDDPSWEVRVGSVELGKTQRWMILTAVTAVVLLSVVGQVIFSAAFFCAMLVLAHGVLHPPVDPAVLAAEEVQQMI
eukprot:TRINITY_DN74681_c0_g1_i1.p1 TRINITY_DN74681_c0_g1~~TRINITY_DN74681_c0_g1_i1.p1  ORF type:complete len:206 (+),score=41.32 TRINITY_DN74681_c0_g1_i1:128-745(+)